MAHKLSFLNSGLQDSLNKKKQGQLHKCCIEHDRVDTEIRRDKCQGNMKCSLYWRGPNKCCILDRKLELKRCLR